VAFQSDREGDLAIYWQRSDGSTPAERLTKPDMGTTHIPKAWSPDGNSLLLGVNKGATNALRSFSLLDKKETPLTEELSDAIGFAATFSPDGRSVAYTQRAQIFVEPFPSTGAKYSVPSAGFHPVWSRDGKAIFFLSQDGLSAVSVTTRPTFAFGNPETAVPRAGLPLNPFTERNYDVTPDGKRIIGVVDVAQPGSSASAPQIQIVLNWLEELKKRVPSRN
jgi:Tol biopolymer transport system component